MFTNIKTVFSIIFLPLLFAAIFSPSLLYAALPGEGDPPGESTTKLVNPIKWNSIPELLAQLLDLVVMVAVPIAILFLIYAGFLFVSARGSEEKLTKAKSVLLYTVIGIALIVGAALLANVIEGTIDQLEGTASLLIIHHS